VIKTPEDLRGWERALQSQPFPLTVSYVRGAKRTNPQNKTIHMHYAQIAAELGDTTEVEVRAECKLIFGVPILRRDDPAFKADYDATFKPLPYETKRKMFEVLDPAITSKMNTKQLGEYMDAMMQHFAEAGVRLIDPSLQKYEGNE